MQIQSEQRASPRIQVTIPVKLICSNEKTFVAQINSLNEQGFLCSMKKSLPLQTPVRIIMLIPPTEEARPRQSAVVTGEGIVIRENIKENLEGDLGHAVAIQFTNLISDDSSRLKAFIKYYSNKNLN